MSTAALTPARAPSRLHHFPVSFFAVVMGLAGTAIAWRRAETLLHLNLGIGHGLGWLSMTAFVLIALTYAAKALLHPDAVRKEFLHPVRMNFFPAMSIGLLLLAILQAEAMPALAQALWGVGTAVHLAFTLLVMNRWIHHPGVELSHVSPAWFIPVVGNILVPIAGVRFFPVDVSWFFFSIGIVFWPLLLTVVLYRLFFHAPLPQRMTPTLFILVAPPAVGCIAWVALTGQVDAMAHVLYSTALFFTLLLTTNALRFLRTPFFLSAWAYSFPLAAMAIASLLMFHHTTGIAYAWIGNVLLALLSAVVAFLLARTALAMWRHEICVEE